MPDMTPRNGFYPSAPDTFHPSSWKQIVDNMRKLLKLREQLGNLESLLTETEKPDITELINTILKSISNIIGDIDGMQGVINTLINNIDQNTPPSGYTHDITYEFKKTDVVGLSDAHGFESLSHAFIMTVTSNSVEGDNFVPYQLATGNTMHQYYRVAKSVGGNGALVWDEWVELRYGTKMEVYESEPEADLQVPGDFWLLKTN